MEESERTGHSKKQGASMDSIEKTISTRRKGEEEKEEEKNKNEGSGKEAEVKNEGEGKGEIARLGKTDATCLIVNEKTSKETVKEWMKKKKKERNETPIGFRWSGRDLDSEWAEAAEISIHKDHHSPRYQTERRKKILRSINDQAKTMGPEAEERVREYAKAPKDPEHLKMIKRIFDNTKAKFDKYVNTEGLKSWASVFESPSPSKAVMRGSLKFKMQGVKGHRVEEYSVDPGVIVLTSPLVQLEACSVMPRKNYFLSVRTSFKTRDTNALSHIPYVGDRHHDEEAFTNELVALYDEGVHGTRPSYKRGINDRILFEMLAAIDFQARDQPELRDRYYAALHHLFPDKCGVREIHKKAILLRKRFEESNRLPYPAPRSAYCGLPWAQIRQMEEADQELEQDCYRCGLTGCNRHDQIDASIMAPYRKPPAPPLDCITEPRPCSFLCHHFFKARMLHQEENVRRKRWKHGEWKPFWYKVIVKRRKRKTVKRKKGNGRRTMDAKRIKLELPEEEKSQDGCISQGEERPEDNDDDTLKERSEKRDDESDIDNAIRAPSTSRSQSIIESEQFPKNENGDASQIKDNDDGVASGSDEAVNGERTAEREGEFDVEDEDEGEEEDETSQTGENPDNIAGMSEEEESVEESDEDEDSSEDDDPTLGCARERPFVRPGPSRMVQSSESSGEEQEEDGIETDSDDEEENSLDEASVGEDEEKMRDGASQRITTDEESDEEGPSTMKCSRELAFMGMAGVSGMRGRSESSYEEEEGWSDRSEWKDEVVDEDGEWKYVKTRRSFTISSKDIVPRKWRSWIKPGADCFPKPFWTDEEENTVKKALAQGQSVCEIIAELQMNWKLMGQMHRYRECYQAHAYLQSNRLFTVKQEYDDEPVVSNADRLQIQKAWRKYNANTIMENNHTLTPCFHPGRCDEQKDPPCECFELDIPCTKFCGCDVRCRIKFPGCMCAPGKCRSKQCTCYYASWECDPDTCKSCGCEETDPLKQCQNLPIALGKRKRIFASRSEIAGYGAFIGEDCKKGELIEEYVGEIISVEESERRGHMYDKLRLSYTFTLNEDEVVDATRAGNVARFINHSKFPNCVARVFVVKGDHRIGIFARRDLSLGEELFFNYGYKKEHVEKFTNKEREGCDITLLDTTSGNVREEEEDDEDDDNDSDSQNEGTKNREKSCRFEKKNQSDKRIFKLIAKLPE